MKKQSYVDWMAEQTDIAIMKFLSKINHPTKEVGRAAGELALKIKDNIQTARQMHRDEVEDAVDDWTVNGNRKGKDYYDKTFQTP